jgi:hypothetical protein
LQASGSVPLPNTRRAALTAPSAGRTISASTACATTSRLACPPVPLLAMRGEASRMYSTAGSLAAARLLK